MGSLTLLASDPAKRLAAALAMVAALAPHVDGAISKTLSVPQATTPEDIQALLQTAWRLGLKGISVFRRGSRPGVLVS